MLRSDWLVVPLLFLVASLNIAGLMTGWYQEVSWYGYAVHALGGFTVAAFFASALRRLPGAEAALRGSPRFILLLGGVALAGVLWEFFEFVLSGATAASAPLRIQLSIEETMADLAFDLAGGALFSLLALF